MSRANLIFIQLQNKIIIDLKTKDKTKKIINISKLISIKINLYLSFL